MVNQSVLLRFFLRLLFSLGFFCYATTAYSLEDSDNPWPHEIIIPEGRVVVYQPQPENLRGNQLTGRFAVSIELKKEEQPVFGAVWFAAQIRTDREVRTATLETISMTRVRIPAKDDAKEGKLKALLEREIPKWHLHISMDRLIASLDIEKQQIKASEGIRTESPEILFVPEPAVLISIDGEPRLKKENNSNVMRVINTPYTLLLDPDSGSYFLNASEKIWYKAKDLNGDWKLTGYVPKKIANLAVKSDKQQSSSSREKGKAPKIIVSTRPAELISTAGAPEYSPISGTSLLYMSNTESHVLMDVTSQKHYVLLAGRWYVAKSMQGPWSFVPGDKLPKDFSRIPEQSKMASVLYAVPGTQAAREAVLDAQFPQTAMIDRKKAKLKIEYDGPPKFEKIEGTKMTYAVNSQVPVIHVASRYYAVDNAVWFVSNSTTSTWQVATEIPAVIYTIPPSSPVYHVTFVRIYKATPDVVYVGYTPGYTGTYVYHQTIVYGTGYYYPYWYGHYYYPRPATWGFHVTYNPWSGWGFGLSYSTGPFTFMIGGGGWYGGGWWGPAHYHAGYRHGWANGVRAGYWAGQQRPRPDLYRNAANRDRVRPSTRDRKIANRDRKRPVQGGNPATRRDRKVNKPSTMGRAAGTNRRANNVFADRDGNIYRKNGPVWEQRTQYGWKRDNMGQGNRPSTRLNVNKRPSQGLPSRNNNMLRNQQLNRSYNARQRGSQRARNFQRSGFAGGFRGGMRAGRR